MRWQTFYYLLCALVLAAIVHISVILLIPSYGTQDAYAIISRKIEPFAFRPIPGTGPDALLSDIDPFFAYGVCRFELENRGLYMSGPKIDSFWSATVLDEDGTVIYSLNSRTAIEGKLDLILLDPVEILRLREVAPPEAETSIIVEGDIKAGFVVLRVLMPDDSWQVRAQSFLEEVSCAPYRPSTARPEPAEPVSG
ncbi:MAG: hypothetical protein VYD64_00605 [Pseudomonadota bacterium]|nr:hypothetical protein [Pseudomonadota bacterium]